MTGPFYSPTSRVLVIQFLPLITYIRCVPVFYFGNSEGCTVESHWACNVHVSTGWWYWTSFHLCLSVCTTCFVKCLFRSFDWIVWVLTLSIENSSYILDISSFLELQFANIFSRCFICHFILFSWYFTEQNFYFILMRSHLSFFSFHGTDFWCYV